MITVKVGKNGFEQALRKFKRKVNDSGILREARSRQTYEKPCDKRNRKKKAAIARNKKPT